MCKWDDCDSEEIFFNNGSNKIHCKLCNKVVFDNKGFKDMTSSEAEQFFGVGLFNKIKQSDRLLGCTCMVNKEGKMIVYACDWENAYRDTIFGKGMFWD